MNAQNKDSEATTSRPKRFAIVCDFTAGAAPRFSLDSTDANDHTAREDASD